MGVLPDGWCFPPLNDLLKFVIGGDWGKAPDFIEDGYEDALCIRGAEFKKWNKLKASTASLRKLKIASLEKRCLQLGDILIEISGGGPDQPVGRTVLIDNDVLKFEAETPKVCTNFLRLARPFDSINSVYLQYYLTVFYMSGEVVKYQSGSNNLRNLKFIDYSQISVPIPPLNEQIRIANKLDTLLAKVEAAQTRLEKIPTLLKRFRQSVLAAATSGELTREWRGEDQFGKVVSIGDIALDIKYGTSKKCDYHLGNTPVLRIPNINDRGINMEDLKSANFSLKEKEKLFLQPGDLLIIRSNGSVDLVGKAALITEKEKDCLYAGYLIRVRFKNLSEIIPKYVLYSLQSPEMRKIIENNARSTSGVNNINSKEIAALCINLPLLEEQKEIVRRVEALFTLADSVEKQYQQAFSRLKPLLQSILAKGFRGELVAQDPNDEPAEQLLARIQEQREKLKPTKNSHRNSKKPKNHRRSAL